MMALAAGLALLLGACSNVCRPEGVPGTYTLTLDQDTYSLQLNPDGTGALGIAGKNIGDFQWEMSSPESDQQIGLKVPGTLLHTFNKLARAVDRRTETPPYSSAWFMLQTDCNGDGILKHLDTGVDQSVWINPCGTRCGFRASHDCAPLVVSSRTRAPLLFCPARLPFQGLGRR